MARRKEITQEDRVLKYMRDFGSITSLDAFRDLGVTRLSAKIFNLKSDYHIEYKWEITKNRYGDTVKFKRYYLVGDQDENIQEEEQETI